MCIGVEMEMRGWVGCNVACYDDMIYEEYN